MSVFIKADEFGATFRESDDMPVRYRLLGELLGHISKHTLTPGKACAVFVTVTAKETEVPVDEAPEVEL